MRELIVQGPSVQFVHIVRFAKETMQMMVPLHSNALPIVHQRRARQNQLQGTIFDKLMTSLLLERESSTLTKSFAGQFQDDKEKYFQAKHANMVGLNGYPMQPEILRVRFNRSVAYSPHPHVNVKDLQLTRSANIGSILRPLLPVEEPFLNCL
jgi:hypothetical protein